MFISWPREQESIVIKIISYCRKITSVHFIHSNGREIELRSGHRHQNVKQIVNEERSDQHEANLLKPFKTGQEIIYHHNQHHGIVKEIPHIERLTEPHGRTQLAKFHRRLAMENSLLSGSKHVIQVREQAVEFKRIRIPVCQQ